MKSSIAQNACRGEVGESTKSSRIGVSNGPSSLVRKSLLSFAGAALVVLPLWAAPSAAVRDSLNALRAVGPNGQGTEAAQAAVKRLTGESVAILPDVLKAMDGANDYSLNWLRAVADAIAGKPNVRLPISELNRFIANTEHHPRARRLAFELLQRADSKAAQKLLPTFLNDPSNELRRDAVAEELSNGASKLTEGKKDEAIKTFQLALNHARDIDQIESVAKSLRDLGQTVDLQKTFGWVTRWKLVGPFDNVAGVGFDKAYTPESNADLAAEYDVQVGKAKWKDFSSKSEYGLVNFNEPYTALKGVGGYAQSDFYSDRERDVEIRIGCKNAWKLWVNGQFLFGRDEYHRGAEIDQYRIKTHLNAGKNTFLVKCLQNEQKEEWTVEWEFQLRVTDAQGTPIVSTQ
jgi:tetratricopeptide (TPR) repeat protein